MTCPHCREAARCKGFRPRTAVGLLGAMRLSRHYYLCEDCHRGTFPWDDQLGLHSHDLTPAAAEIVCLAGLLASFAEAAQKTLPRMSGLHVSEATVERATEATGHRLGAALAAGLTFGDAKAWDWHKDAEGKTVAYVLGDSTGVGMQGAQGAKAEGRMANVVVIANPVPEERARWADPARQKPPPWQTRYLATLQPWSELRTMVRRQGNQVGMDQAERWVALADGANGLDDFLEKNFPRVEVVILDFWHATEYLGGLAKALHPGSEAACQAWLEQWCHKLKHEGGQAVLDKLRTLEVSSSAAQASLEEVVTYFTNQVHRMDYPAYRAKGWCIGSGVVESACKRVVGQRLKGSGMRWGEDGANAVCHLRALFLSDGGQWKAFWSSN
jgi:hypothetical protein